MRQTLHTIVTITLAMGLGIAQAAAPASNDKPTQQSKMKACHADAKAKGLKGADRKAFMSECLKAK